MKEMNTLDTNNHDSSAWSGTSQPSNSPDFSSEHGALVLTPGDPGGLNSTKDHPESARQRNRRAVATPEILAARPPLGFASGHAYKRKLGWNPLPNPLPRDAALRVELEERFMAKVSPEPTTGCWLWTGAAERRGYGHFMVGRKQYVAHRIAFWLFVADEIPTHLMCDHRCRQPSCVNPAHLELVDNRTNVMRGMSPIALANRTGLCKWGHPLKIRTNGQTRCLTCASIYGKRIAASRQAVSR